MRLITLFSVIVLSYACDLIPLVDQLTRSFVIDELDSQRDPCLIKENCFAGPGRRTVLRFDSHVHNRGRFACQVGSTPRCPVGDDSNVPDQHPFNYDTCHKHWHLTGFSKYLIRNINTNAVVAQGDKNGLCLMDVICPSGKHFTCSDQGISAGCTDVYDKGLDCQWVDITNLVNHDDNTRGGNTYDFYWEINPGRFIRETDYNNNSVKVRINLDTIPRRTVRGSAAPNQCPTYRSSLRTNNAATNQGMRATNQYNQYSASPYGQRYTSDYYNNYNYYGGY